MQQKMKLVPGQIVRSLAGHDKDSIFFVVGIVDDYSVLIADGDRRRIESPKRKKAKHLQPYDRISDVIAERIESGARIANIDLQRELEKSGAIELAISDQEEMKVNV